MTQSAKNGQMGEKLAARYYRWRGYKLLETNYRTRMGEIDLILKKGDVLIFAEVKTRGDRAIAAPREWVNAAKQQKLMLAAQGYLQKNRLSDPVMRFDVVEVILPEKGRPKINCIKNAIDL